MKGEDMCTERKKKKNEENGKKCEAWHKGHWGYLCIQYIQQQQKKEQQTAPQRESSYWQQQQS